MAALADLQPDRRAVLKLLIGRGRGYDQIAELLQLPELVVRRRAHDAITQLAGGKADVDDAQRALLCDYLVGELPASRRAEARKILTEDAGARRFARSAASRLSGIEGAQLPELPAQDEEVAEALDALDARREREVELETSSKRGAYLLIGGVALAVVAVVLVLSLVAGGDSSGNTTTGGAGSSGKTTPAATSPGAATLVAELAPPSGTGSAKGQAALKPNSTGATILALHATGITPTKRLADGRFTAIAIWLEGPSGVAPLRLGFYTPQDTATTPDSGTVDLGITLDGSKTPAVTAATLAKYTKLIVTREILASTTDTPSIPGNVVLSGVLSTLG